MRWIVALLLSGSSLSTAAEPLKLAEALRLARLQSHQLRLSRLQLSAARAAETRAISVLLPKANAQFRFFRNWREISLSLPPGLLPGGQTTVLIQPQTQFDAALTATIPLLVPAAYGAVGAARAQQRAEASRHRAATNDVSFGVARVFFALAGAREVLAARTHALKVADEAVRATRVRRRAGVVRSVEVSRAELAAVAARQAQREAKDAVSKAGRALATALALREPREVVAPPLPPRAVPAEGELVRDALTRRSELTHARHVVHAAEKALASTRWRLAPNLLAFATVRGLNAPGFADNNYAWSAGVMVDIPLFQGGERFAAIEKARIQLDQARIRLKQLADAVADEVRNQRDALETAFARLDSAERGVKLARSTLALVRIQRQVGTATQLEEIDAMDRQVAAEIALAQAKFHLALADLALRKSLGHPVDAR